MSKRLKNFLLIFFAGLIVYIFGIKGLQHTTIEFGLDLNFVYRAGIAMLNGENPYVENSFFAYPPHILPFCLIISLFSRLHITYLIAGLNISLLSLLVFFVSSEVKKKTSCFNFQMPIEGIVACLVVMTPFTLNILFAGQTTIIVTTCLYAAWLLSRRNADYYAGILLGIAAIKPHFVLLPIFWFGLEKKWKLLVVTAGFIALLLSIPFLMFGIIPTITSWIECVKNYKQNSYFDAIGSDHVLGLESVLYALDFPVFNLAIIGLAFVYFRWMFLLDKKQFEVLPFLMISSVLFIYAHDYDLVVMIPVIPVIFHLFYLSVIKTRVFIFINWILLIVPLRIIKILDVAILIQWRTLLLLFGFLPLLLCYSQINLHRQKQN